MLRYILFEASLFGPGESAAEAETDLNWMLEALVQRDQDYLKQHPETPRLYKSGVYWEAPKQFAGECEEVHVLRAALGASAKQRDVRKVLEKVQQVFGGEYFADVGVILRNGKHDCDGLAAWRTAELRQAGIPAKAMMTKRQRVDGGTTYHALVMWPPFGTTPYPSSEDTSLILGMGGADRAADRAEELRKNADRCNDIKTMGSNVLHPMAPSAPGAIEDVLGLRRRPDATLAISEVERLLRGVG